jgi:LmbE family N-acetylglucosaminyl deacetylase
MAHPYHEFVAGHARLAQLGRGLPLGGFAPLPRPTPAPDAPLALIFSPHPDDECIIGGLALRLMRESGWQVGNVAVTLGSKLERKAGRLRELERACAFLGFDLIRIGEAGLDAITPKARAADAAGWAAKVDVIASLLAEQRPCVIFFPHDQDWNSTHVGVHWLLADALARQAPTFETFTVETEFWGQCDDPNLMVESSVEELADLVAACSFHEGEVRRNPYHILTPAWMMDNVRRGGELVGGQGGAAPSMTFATLYRLRRWRAGRFERFYAGGRMLASGELAGRLFD